MAAITSQFTTHFCPAGTRCIPSVATHWVFSLALTETNWAMNFTQCSWTRGTMFFFVIVAWPRAWYSHLYNVICSTLQGHVCSVLNHLHNALFTHSSSFTPRLNFSAWAVEYNKFVIIALLDSISCLGICTVSRYKVLHKELCRL